MAARQIQHSFSQWRVELVRAIGLGDVEIGIGIGIDSGETNFGEFGQTHRDLTAVGTVVNRAARAQAAAKSGEILVTSAVRDRTGEMVTATGTDYTLKGFGRPVTLFSA
jgi:adenylate cyclase